MKCLMHTVHKQCCCVCKHHWPVHYHCITKPLPKNLGDEDCRCGVQKGWACVCPESGRVYDRWPEHSLCEYFEFKEPKKPATSVEKKPEEPTKLTLDDFAKKHNLRIVAQKDEGFLSTKHYVCLENTGVTTGGPFDMRYSCSGSTSEEAKAAHAASISGKTIRVTRPNGDHELIKVPMLVG